MSGLAAYAQVLTPNLEVKHIGSVGAGWKTISLKNNYANTVVICTYHLPNKNSKPATTRIRNITANSFDVRIQKFQNNNNVSASDVHCLIADEGAYTIGGLKFEARTVLSNRTSGENAQGWETDTTEDVTSQLTQSYSAPIVLGQVMSFNNTKASVFWSNNCTNRSTPPFTGNSRLCVGKHIGQINDSRNAETLGVIVAETGSGTQNGIKYALRLGPSTIQGVGNSPAYNYTVSGNFDTGIVSQSGQNGSQGGWAVLYGNNPLPSNIIRLAIDEETIAGNKNRKHTDEQVAYWVFKDNQSANLNSSGSINMASNSTSPYAIPGSELLYTLEIENTGSKAVNSNSIVIIDAVPEQTIFYNGDIDGAGPETGTITFNSAGSGLNFTEATDLAFSSASIKPSSFAACTYTPAAGYDVNVNFICLNPKGKLNAGSLETSNFSLSFRAQVK